MAVISLGEAVTRLADNLFVGRGAELAIFREWLSADSAIPEILDVSGPSGVGKTTVLYAFKQIAHGRGRDVVFVDGSTLPINPRALLRALGGSAANDVDRVVARLNAAGSLILLDSVEEVGALTDYIQSELLPRLATSVRVVIAGRVPLGLAWSRNDIWNKIIRHIRLNGFSPMESREYLHRRGVEESGLVEHVIWAAGNNPLALSLAADLATQFGVRNFPSAPEWRLAVRTLVDRVMIEVKDQLLRDLLEASLAVRQFDETTLAAISGRIDIGAAFDQLCQLSIVSPTGHGLMLHDDVRRRLTEDLAWRHPDRYAALRSRALGYYRERVRTATPEEREWLVADRFYLWGNALIQELFFSSDEPGQLWVGEYRAADHAEVRRLFSKRLTSPLPAGVELGDLSPPPEDDDFLDAVLSYPSARVRVARDRDGRALGFSTVLPVSRESIPLLDLHPAFAPAVHAFLGGKGASAVPSSPRSPTISYLLHMVHSGESDDAVRGSLLRDLSSIFASGGIYLAATFALAYKRMLETCGFQRLPGARNFAWGMDHPVDAYVLDLSQIGVEPWLEAVMDGREPPRPLGRAELETELQVVFRHWTDDARLASSRLADLPLVVAVGGVCPAAAAIRQAITGALAAARAKASDEEEAAYKALELVYLYRRPCRKASARNLSVSRATLYRLVKRGIQGLADALMQS